MHVQNFAMAAKLNDCYEKAGGKTGNQEMHQIAWLIAVATREGNQKEKNLLSVLNIHETYTSFLRAYKEIATAIILKEKQNAKQFRCEHFCYQSQ